ncbi:MAG: hypothetical protein Q7R72_01200 [bacterium]|nr:hypothetical protein [bacterium]
MKTKKGKYEIILDRLLAGIERREGNRERVKKLRDEIIPYADEGTYREIISQYIARENCWVRLKFFCLFPSLFFPYLMRVGKKDLSREE